MPELPEVETTRRGLAPVLLNQAIRAVDVARRDLRWAIPDDFEALVTGRRIVDLTRRAKYILMELDSGATILSHLGMSGRFAMYEHPPTTFPAHSHVVLYLESGPAVAYIDPRRFGMLDILEPNQLSLEGHPLLQNLGVEPLSADLTFEYLAAALARKSAPIKNVLLDQRVIAGLGNIYVCEALFQVGIAPDCPAREVGAARVWALIPAIQAVLESAIAAGGSSLRDHRQTDGKLGYFQKQFQVYGREGESCFRCETPIDRLTQAGRSTFFCPTCQAG